jgi:hypothetical protein
MRLARHDLARLHCDAQACRLEEKKFVERTRKMPSSRVFRCLWRQIAALGSVLMATLSAAADAAYDPAPWADALTAGTATQELRQRFPVEWDWLRQACDQAQLQQLATGQTTSLGRTQVAAVVAGLTTTPALLRAEHESLLQQNTAAGDRRWVMLFARACEARRAQRLACLLEKPQAIAFIKRKTIRPSFFAYTEGQSDAQSERHFLPGATLCRLRFTGTRGMVEPLLDDPRGMLRDPAVSWDATRLAFAWKKSLNDDDYHLYELDLTNQSLRQLTAGTGVADYEPAYLPNDDLIFASTRCVQTVDCWWTEASNLYACDPNGKRLRRLGFDQVHTVYPQVLDDGRVIYTRWDYNDRGQIFPQPLFQMNPDGSGQAGFYGNSSWFPTTIAHARGIPGSGKVLAILCGHHSPQTGKLAVIDPALGREENQGVQLVSPVRETKAERIDAYGQQGELFCYPFPLSSSQWLVSYAPDGWGGGDHKSGDAKFGLYWMNRDGHRELLASDPTLPCLQPVVLAPRSRPVPRPSQIDWRRDTAACYVSDVYQGPGLAGVPRGTIRKLRVIALDFRVAGIGENYNSGPAGGALVSTPIAIGNGAWDVKRVLGDATVHDDGSAYFEVPARTPVYFQALDARGRAVQTMRSWNTLQPGEVASCIGCHENRNSTSLATPSATNGALHGSPQKLIPFYGPPRGFSFPREIQPILDRNCIRCHRDREPLLAMAAGKGPPPLDLPPAVSTSAPDQASNRLGDTVPAFSLLGETTRDVTAKREWSDAYLVLTRARRDGGGSRSPFRGQPDSLLINWIGVQSPPTPLPPNTGGAIKSGLLTMLEKGHGNVRLTREDLEKLACWIDLLVPYCGEFTESNIWGPQEREKFRYYDDKRKRMDELDRAAIREMAGASRKPPNWRD